MYSIKAVSRATGLSVETLRAWERRYGIVVPHRDERGRRVYRAEDVLRLRRLREATERGHPIGRLAPLGEQQLAGLLDGGAAQPAQATCDAFVTRVLDAAARYHVVECEQALTLAIATLPPPRLVRDVLRPLLVEVGERWHRREFSIAQERLVSTTVRRHVGLVLDTYDRSAQRPAIVFATLPGERHELGLLMAALQTASFGFKVHYLGPDLPPGEIARYATQVGAAVIAISIVFRDTLSTLPAQLDDLVRDLPPDLPVWLGGFGTAGLAGGALPPRCVLIRDALDLEQRLRMVAAA